jgi:hypothetical protein
MSLTTASAVAVDGGSRHEHPAGSRPESTRPAGVLRQCRRLLRDLEGALGAASIIGGARFHSPRRSHQTAVTLAAWSADAAERELAWRAAVHAAAAHELPVPGAEGHALGVAAFRGLAFFDGGEIASHRYTGHFDFTDGSGSIAGYAIWTFEDGATLRARYRGEATAAGEGITFTGSYSEVTGDGRFAGATGSGSFEGRRLDPFADGGDTYLQGRLELTGGG